MNSPKFPPVPPAGVFAQYAQYYDLLYADKEYAREAAFVHDLILRHGGRCGKVLEFGCGSGKHAFEMAARGWIVTGIDLSPEMVQQAQSHRDQALVEISSRVEFGVGDIRTCREKHQFDAVVSLFHVICYQTSNRELEDAFATAAAHLGQGGVFLFDFWYGPAVLSDPPVLRVKRMESARIQATRIAEPTACPNENRVAVSYHVFVRDKGTTQVDELKEVHHMRYLFLPEIESLLDRAGFDLVSTGKWLSDLPLSESTWYGYAVARKR
jgi:SAM-dependent methyltransferase